MVISLMPHLKLDSDNAEQGGYSQMGDITNRKLGVEKKDPLIGVLNTGDWHVLLKGSGER